ncbi:MAG: GspH/FimT family pseudopilin [Lysobacterales bacterium]
MPLLRLPGKKAIRGCRGLRQSGFTMVELMVTVAVAAVLLALATPSFEGVLNGNRLASQSNELVAALQIGRSEAVKNNARVIVCRSTNLTTCAAGAAWTGWVAGIDSNRDGQVDQVLKVGSISAPLQVFSSSNIEQSRVTIRPDGYAYKQDGTLLVASIAVCIPTIRPTENVRAVTITAGSRIETKSLDGGGACAVLGNTP